MARQRSMSGNAVYVNKTWKCPPYSPSWQPILSVHSKSMSVVFKCLPTLHMKNPFESHNFCSSADCFLFQTRVPDLLLLFTDIPCSQPAKADGRPFLARFCRRFFPVKGSFSFPPLPSACSGWWELYQTTVFDAICWPYPCPLQNTAMSTIAVFWGKHLCNEVYWTDCLMVYVVFGSATWESVGRVLTLEKKTLTFCK